MAESAIENLGLGNYKRLVDEYKGESDQPVLSYLVMMGIYTALCGGLYAVVKKQKAEPHFTGGDYALLTVATYKLARIITMDWVTSPLRAPFATRGKSLPDGEVQDKSRGQGVRKALGNLLTCPYCFSVWSATALVFGLTVSTRATRLFMSVLGASSGADLLHSTRKALRQRYLEAE